MDLSSTAYVVLGALDERPRSGYDIKQFADKSIRLFWAVGFGQLYPELKLLTEAGLIEGSDASTGGRKRTLYRITDRGREALADWVSDAGDRPQEVRDELLVRLFFSDAADLSTRVSLAGRIAERHRASRAYLCHDAEKREVREPGPERSMHKEVLDFGIAYHTFIEEWFEHLAQRLSENEDTNR
ncbi:MAG: PadR family transcriptional regulator [Candidatus Dormibacteraceae bacterium]